MMSWYNTSPYLFRILVNDILPPPEESNFAISVKLLDNDVSKESWSTLEVVDKDRLGHESMSNPEAEGPSLESKFKLSPSFLPMISALEPGAFCSFDLELLASWLHFLASLASG